MSLYDRLIRARARRTGVQWFEPAVPPRYEVGIAPAQRPAAPSGPPVVPGPYAHEDDAAWADLEARLRQDDWPEADPWFAGEHGPTRPVPPQADWFTWLIRIVWVGVGAVALGTALRGIADGDVVPSLAGAGAVALVGTTVAVGCRRR